MNKKSSFLDQIIRNNIEAQAEIFYTKNNQGVPDYQDVDLVSRTEEYLEILPPRQKKLLKSMFVAFEIFIPLAFLRFQPFSKLKKEGRVKIMKFLQRSKFYLIRSTFDSIKAVMAMMYLSHADSLEHLGYYKTTRNPGDDFRAKIKKGRLASAGKKLKKVVKRNKAA